MAELRRCIVCGKIYEYCIHCGDSKQDELWKYVYHDENCMAINHILRSYRGGEISKDEAKQRMDQYPQNIAIVLNSDSIIANEIKDIYSAINVVEPVNSDIETEDNSDEVVTHELDSDEIEVISSESSADNKKTKSRRNTK